MNTYTFSYKLSFEEVKKIEAKSKEEALGKLFYDLTDRIPKHEADKVVTLLTRGINE